MTRVGGWDPYSVPSPPPSPTPPLLWLPWDPSVYCTVMAKVASVSWVTVRSYQGAGGGGQPASPCIQRFYFQSACTAPQQACGSHHNGHGGEGGGRGWGLAAHHRCGVQATTAQARQATKKEPRQAVRMRGGGGVQVVRGGGVGSGARSTGFIACPLVPGWWTPCGCPPPLAHDQHARAGAPRCWSCC